jgi:hypothetical protein
MAIKKKVIKRGRPAGSKTVKKPTAAADKVAQVYKTEGGMILFVENGKIMTKFSVKNGGLVINGVEVPARDCYLSLRRLGKKIAEA